MESLRKQLIEAGVWSATDARDPSVDLLASYELRDYIVKHHLAGDYERALLDILEEVNGFQTTMFDLVFAAPFHRCKALLRVVLVGDLTFGQI